MSLVCRRRDRSRIDAHLTRTGDVLKTTLDRAAEIAGTGAERIGDVVDTVRPAIARALDGAEVPDALRQAFGAGALTIVPGAHRTRCGGRGRIIVPVVLAATAAILCLIVWRRRRNRQEAPPEGASA